jgi:hypothetical protein
MMAHQELPMNFTVRHPNTGTRILVLEGETIAQAVARYNTTILGFDPLEDPNLADNNFLPEPHTVEVFTARQLATFREQGVSVLRDPHSMNLITIDEYQAKYVKE